MIDPLPLLYVYFSQWKFNFIYFLSEIEIFTHSDMSDSLQSHG